MSDSRIDVDDQLLRSIFFQPETCPGMSLSGDYAADGHGGPGHLKASSDECGTHAGMVCFRGALLRMDGHVYRVICYDRNTRKWEVWDLAAVDTDRDAGAGAPGFCRHCVNE